MGREPHGCRQRHVVVGVGRRRAGAPCHHPHLPGSADHSRHRQPQGSQDAGTDDVTSPHTPTHPRDQIVPYKDVVVVGGGVNG